MAFNLVYSFVMIFYHIYIWFITRILGIMAIRYIKLVEQRINCAYLHLVSNLIIFKIYAATYITIFHSFICFLV